MNSWNSIAVLPRWSLAMTSKEKMERLNALERSEQDDVPVTKEDMFRALYEPDGELYNLFYGDNPEY